MSLVELTTAPVGVEARRWSLPVWLERLVGAALLLGAWQLAASVGWITEDTLASPSSVVDAARGLIESGQLQEALWVSVQRVFKGLAIGVPVGVALAIVAGLWRVGDDVVDTPVQMLRFVPIIGLQPLILQWFGIGEAAKVSLIILGAIFPVYINTYAAIRSIDTRYLELARVQGLSRITQIRRVVLPGALPGFLVGLRQAFAVGWLILVFAEQLNASAGLGYLMNRSQVLFRSDVIVTVLVVYALLGLGSDLILRTLEGRLLRWHPSR
jgi:sulfonate transport system permease protein